VGPREHLAVNPALARPADPEHLVGAEHEVVA
jgi:hypothetical protein